MKRLRDQPAEERVLILLTDGANTAGTIAPLKAAELAREAGIRIHTIGVGSDPRAGLGAFGFGMARNPLDEATLSALAEQTGGRYFRARDVRELQGIYAALDELEPVESDEQTFRPVGELFAWPLGLSLLLSAMVAGGRLGLFSRTSGWWRWAGPMRAG